MSRLAKLCAHRFRVNSPLIALHGPFLRAYLYDKLRNFLGPLGINVVTPKWNTYPIYLLLADGAVQKYGDRAIFLALANEKVFHKLADIYFRSKAKAYSASRKNTLLAWVRILKFIPRAYYRWVFERSSHVQLSSHPILWCLGLNFVNVT